jgi:hypothetical protein
MHHKDAEEFKKGKMVNQGDLTLDKQIFSQLYQSAFSTLKNYGNDDNKEWWRNPSAEERALDLARRAWNDYMEFFYR